MKKRLLNGEVLELQNCSGDCMVLSFRKTLGGSMEFVVELNAKIIKMCKTFKAFENKVNELIEDRTLVDVDLDDNHFERVFS